MKSLVVIKSNKYCLELHMDADASFDKILEALHNKFLDSARFFGNAKMALAFYGRILGDEEEQQVLQLITDLTQIEIICVLNYSGENEPYWKSLLEHSTSIPQKQDAQIYRGSLGRHQTLESTLSVIVLGDVELGAKVIADGNVIIVGTLRGVVHAGASGDLSAYVVALTMQPKQLKIGEIEAKRQIIYQEGLSIQGPKIAVVDGHRIYVDPLIE